MPFQIIRNDIIKVKADAIVNTANPKPTFAGAVDTAIFKAAGQKEMLAARRKIGDIARGDIGVTPAFGLKAKYVIHTVGPVWKDGKSGELETLASCYEKSVQKAIELKCKSIAFPLISTGVYGFPKDKALQVAMSVLQDAAMKDDIRIYLVVYSGDAYELSGKVFDDIETYIDENYVEEQEAELEEEIAYRRNRDRELREPLSFAVGGGVDSSKKVDFEALLGRKEQTFQEKLFEYIDASGLTDLQVYKPIDVSRQTFSKIRSNPDYQPTKQTAVSFCLQLKLDLEQTEDLLQRAGYGFSPTNKYDVIIKGAIVNQLYDIQKIDLVLIKHNCPTIKKYT